MDIGADGYAYALFNATGTSVVTSGRYQVAGVVFMGTATGGVQFYAATTTSASMTPMITFSATTSAVAGGFSPMFLRMPFVGSGSGLTVKMLGSADPNIGLFWRPLSDGT